MFTEDLIESYRGLDVVFTTMVEISVYFICALEP